MNINDYKKSCFELYRDDSEVMLEIEPLGNEYKVHNNTGAFFSEKYKVMTESELLHFKSVHNLLFEHELGTQLSIFDL